MRIRFLLLFLLWLPALAFGQQRGQRGQAPAPPSAPTPRYPDGHPMLSAAPGKLDIGMPVRDPFLERTATISRPIWRLTTYHSCRGHEPCTMFVASSKARAIRMPAVCLPEVHVNSTHRMGC